MIKSTKAGLDDGLRSTQLMGGSMLDPFPESIRGAIVYQFRLVLHDFPDNDVLRALRSAREAAAPDTRVLVIEELLHPDRSKFSIGQDIFLLCVGGKRRSAAMYSKLAESAGFRLNSQFHDTVNDCGVLEFVVI